jgi:hypothetical protein
MCDCLEQMTKEQTRDLSPQAMRALFQPNSVNAEKRTVDLVWTKGASVVRQGWDGPFNEELSLDPRHVRMGRLTSGRAPLLANHDGSSIDSMLGVIESARLENGQGVATVRFAAEGINPAADKAFRMIQDGILANVSVGYRVHKFEQVDAQRGEKVPTYRAVDWEPFEISAVPMGADDGAAFRSTETNAVTIITSGEPQGVVQMADEKQTPPAPVDAEAIRAEERTRVTEINTLVRSVKLDQTVADELVAAGKDINAARAVVLEKLAARDAETPPAKQISATVSDDRKDKFARGMTAWMIEKSGKGVIEEAKKRGVRGFENVELDGGEFRGAGLVDIARACLEMNGVSTRNMYNKMEIVKRALSVRGGQASTGDFSVLFENVMYKTMRAAYATQADTWRRFCGTDTVSDFRNSNRFMNGSFGTLDVIAENGEYVNKSIPDGAKISISTQTYGNIISISRQALINDDMGALADLAVRFGRSAGLSIESAVYALLAQNSGLGPTCTDGIVFFHASHANISTGAALSAAALDADRLKMRQQQDISSNEYLDLNPRIMLLPIGLETAAKILNTDAFDPAQTGQKSNSARGLFSDIVTSPRLSWSTTRRYLFTEGKEAFKVVFLEGSGEGPTMESEQGFDVDGLRWKARVDFKVNPYDPKTAITNAGV